ncbi:MAG: hypothetical protein IRZ03_17115, partial [Acidobacterium ailaaui]|nr:hypothetical protein [Pseudacidobacterium ailaaui]
YRFIDVIEPGGFRYYKQLIILKGLLNIIIPIIDTNKNHIFLDYNYYTKVHKTNNSLQLINKKYIIDLELIKLLNISEYDMENKDICLDINIAYKDRVD